MAVANGLEGRYTTTNELCDEQNVQENGSKARWTTASGEPWFWRGSRATRRPWTNQTRPRTLLNILVAVSL